MVIMLYFHCKIVNNYPGPNPGLRPRVNPGFGVEKPAGYPGLRGPGAPGLDALDFIHTFINFKHEILCYCQFFK